MGSPSQLVVCSSSADHNLRRKHNMSNHLISCLFASAARYLRLKLEKKKKNSCHIFCISPSHTQGTCFCCLSYLLDSISTKNGRWDLFVFVIGNTRGENKKGAIGKKKGKVRVEKWPSMNYCDNNNNKLNVFMAILSQQD